LEGLGVGQLEKFSRYYLEFKSNPPTYNRTLGSK
jgi:hypothetical protein